MTADDVASFAAGNKDTTTMTTDVNIATATTAPMKPMRPS